MPEHQRIVRGVDEGYVSHSTVVISNILVCELVIEVAQRNQKLLLSV